MPSPGGLFFAVCLCLLSADVRSEDTACYVLTSSNFSNDQFTLSDPVSPANSSGWTIIRIPERHYQVKIVFDSDADDVSILNSTSIQRMNSSANFNGPPPKSSLNDTATVDSSEVLHTSAESNSANSSFSKVVHSDSETADKPLVHITTGPILGVTDHSTGVHRFLGVPYAQPPVGPLRFRHPVAVAAWSDVFIAHHKPFPCMQPHFYINSNVTIDLSNSTEDCLYLNVWTPDNCVLKGDCLPKRSVMVFIYGGTYTFGSSGWNWYDGAHLAALGDVLVLTFNYRVGPFGFLFGGIDDAPGNAGLFDQLMVLHWVQDNIQKFGGNPKDVTLFGQSAGAISIGYHMASPLSQGLFHKAIMESGSPFFRLSEPTREGPGKIERLASALDCQGDDQRFRTHPTEIMNCLRNRNAREILNKTWSIFGLQALTFFPVYGDDFLPEPAQKRIKAGQFAKIPLLIGNNQDEGSYFLFYLFGKSIDFDAIHSIGKYEVSLYVLYGLRALLETNVRPILSFYFDSVNEDEGLKAIRRAADLVGDLAMVCPTKYFAEEASSQGLDVFYYKFDFRSSFSTWPDWVGTTHGEEIPFVFGHPLSGLEPKSTDQDIKASKEVIEIWSRFAKTGKVPTEVHGLVWPKYDKSNQTYLYYGQNELVLENGPNEDACKFWRKYLYDYIPAVKRQA